MLRFLFVLVFRFGSLCFCFFFLFSFYSFSFYSFSYCFVLSISASCMMMWMIPGHCPTPVHIMTVHAGELLTPTQSSALPALSSSLLYLNSPINPNSLYITQSIQAAKMVYLRLRHHSRHHVNFSVFPQSQSLRYTTISEEPPVPFPKITMTSNPPNGPQKPWVVQPGTTPRPHPPRQPQGPADIRATKEYKALARRYVSVLEPRRSFLHCSLCLARLLRAVICAGLGLCWACCLHPCPMDSASICLSID